MADQKTTTSGQSGSNSANRKPVAKRFNLSGGLAEGYEAASDKAKARVIDQIELRDSRVNQRREQQSYWYDKNVAEEKNRLFEDYLSKPSPTPETPEARALVQETISEQAEKNITAKNAYALNVIERECTNNIKEVLRLDQSQKLQNHGHYPLDQHAAPEAEHEQ